MVSYDNKEFYEGVLMKTIKQFILLSTLLVLIWGSDISFGISDGVNIVLTPEEQAYLQNLGPIKVSVDPEWYPFEEIDADGNYRGIAADLLEIISSRLGIEFEIIPTDDWNQSIEYFKSGKSDLLACLNQTPERNNFMLFTDVYFTDPNVLITREEHHYISKIADVSGETVVLPKGTSIEELVKDKFPELKVILVDNETEALEYVTTKKADLTIRSLTIGAYIIKKEGYFNLKIAGQLPAYDNEFRIGINPSMPELQQILNKGISSLTQEEVQMVINKHISINVQQGFDYKLFFIIFGVFSVLLILAIIWNRQLSHLNETLAQRQETLTVLSQQLSESENNYKALAKELERKNTTLEKMASYDKLTGIRNRYYFDMRIIEEVDVVNRYGGSLALILFDLDHFKIVNDTFGHDTGDEVLIAISDTVQKLMRKSDVFARWGGEEFVVLMPQTDTAGANLAAERLRRAIEAIQHPVVGTVTVSVGVSVHEKNESIENWFKRTDVALFKAKRSGRNKVFMCSPQDQDVNVQFEWKQAWSCGNLVLDAQHKELLELGNALLEASINNTHLDFLLHKLDKLIGHVKVHFVEEEAILSKLGFAELIEHEESHNMLIQKAVQLRSKVAAGEMKTSDAFEFIVSDIIMGHLLQEDIKYFPLIAQTK